MKKLLFLLLMPLMANAQYVKSTTAVGSRIVRYPEITVSNTLVNVGVEKSLLPSPDTIYANSINMGGRHYGTMLLNISTPSLSVGGMTIKFKAGPGLASVLTLTNGLALNIGANATPVTLMWSLENKGATQLFNAQIVQNNGVVIPVSLTNMNPQATWNLDMNVDNYFDITVAFTGVTLGTTSYTSKVYRRYIE
jgi:hypothetical protein